MGPGWLRERRLSPLALSRLFLYSSLLIAVLSLYREVYSPYPLVAAAFIPLALFMDQRRWYPVGNRVITVVTLVLVAVHLYGIRLEVFFQRVSQVLMILVVAKLVATKQVRDYLQLALFSLMLVAAAAVGQWGLSFGLLLVLHSALLLLGLLFLYASTEVREISAGEARTLVFWGMVMSGFLMPSSLLFFFLLPRPSVGFTPGWIGGRTVARSGFGDTVSPGAVESIKRDTSVAFRVEFGAGASSLPPTLLYWRGKVYGGYNRGKWFVPRGNAPRRSESISLSSRLVEYRVFLEPYDGNALFTLGVPLRARANRQRVLWREGYTLSLDTPIQRRISYRVTSMLVEAVPADAPPEGFLEVPPKVREALEPVAQSIAPGQENPLEVAKAVQLYLRRNHRYSLNPGTGGDYPVVDFIMRKRPGHCEYFASAMALLLRIKGIPSRLVGGFWGGEWNPLGRYYLVRNSDAHTWVEVWVPWLGWVPFDPTPPAAGGVEAPGVLGRFLDYLRFQWYHWIINYNYQRQVSLFRKGGALLSRGSLSKRVQKEEIPKGAVAAFFGAILVLLFLFYGLRWWSARPKGWGERLDGVLRRAGIQREDGETFREVAGRLRDENRELAERVERAVELYYQVEFGGCREKEEELIEALKGIGR